jgi:hypothetical protein
MEPIRKYGVVDKRDIPLLETGTAYKYSETQVAAAELGHGEVVDYCGLFVRDRMLSCPVPHCLRRIANYFTRHCS